MTYEVRRTPEERARLLNERTWPTNPLYAEIDRLKAENAQLRKSLEWVCRNDPFCPPDHGHCEAEEDHRAQCFKCIYERALSEGAK